MDPIVSLCRRRGFIFQSSELYGGINGFWDYGPLGAELKRNLKEAWWQDVVRCPAPGPNGRPIEIVPVDATIIMNPKVWEASGHVGRVLRFDEHLPSLQKARAVRSHLGDHPRE